MLYRDLVRFSLGVLKAYRMRAFLSALGFAIGIAAVVLLTSIGEGIHQFTLAQFTQFGTNLISVTPGKVKTAGFSVGVFATVRPLTIEDALAIRKLPNIEYTDPVVSGNAEIGFAGRRRRVMVYGVSGYFARALRMDVMLGNFLPAEDPTAPRPLAVLGVKAKNELFGDGNPLGRRVEVAGWHYTVIGVMAPKGQIFGVDLDDSIYIPVASAMQLFNREGLMEIHVTYNPDVPVEGVVGSIHRLLFNRHDREDFTITPQKEALKTLDSVLGMLTFAVAALGAVSILVGAIGILTIMIIAVGERTSEVGLLKALGATHGQVMVLFIAEAALIAFLGGLSGILLALGIARTLAIFVAALPVKTSWLYAVLAECVAVLVGLIAGVLPARAAAKLEPVQALRAE
ncbi:MAG TPA: ABC transporter permease [Candidatus Limnocylindrales bacterium]|nr:ABC transporter permease [Candidatus Limnocylindrales bacterium]